MNSLSMLDIGFYCCNYFAAELTASGCSLKLTAPAQPPRAADFVYFDGLNLISWYDGGTKSVS